MTIYLPIQAGVMIPKCSTKKCQGIMRIHNTLEEVAKVRSGKNKIVTANFSCKCHEEDDRVILHK